MSDDRVVGWLGLISALCFTASYLPQLVRTYRTKDVRGLSTAYWAVIVAGYVTGWCYILSLREPLLFLTYGLGLAGSLAMLVGCFLFRAR